MAASDAIPVPRKNAAYWFYFAIRKPSDSTLITTWAGADSEVSLDGAAYSDCTNEATEIGTTGTGYIDLTSSEMNADCVLLKITVTNTGAVPLVFALYPESAGDYRVADTQKVDVETIKGNPVVNGGTVTFATNTTVAYTTGAVGSVTGIVGGIVTGSVGSVATNGITSTSLATGAITAASIAAAAANKIADHTRRRTQANVEASSDGDAISLGSLYGLIQQAQESNAVDTPGSLTVYQTDGTTSLGTKTLDSDAAADPVVGIS
jgi:hypothetical protein